MKDKVLITAALPYANGPLHFGHIAGAYLPADVQARYQRLQGKEVLYICGSDEYGIAISLSAEMAGRTPKEHVDLFHEINKDFFKKCGIHFDHYSRTTTPYHQKPVQEFFLDLLKNGYIEARETEELYSESENRFLADRYVTGECPKCGFLEARGDECPKCGASFEASALKNPRSKLTGASLVLRKTKHWFLLLDQFKEKLTAWLSEKKWKPNVLNFIKGYIDDLHARAITRDMSWGVPLPLPEADGKVFYVWFDAVIGYISATQEWNPDQWQEWWFDPKTRLIQFMGKDNIPFHAVIFPAMIMGQNRPFILVDDLVANEFYNFEGKKFSKSEGWTIDLDRFFTRFSTDQLRYMIASTAPESADSEFSWAEFQVRCNKELIGKLGNFVQRTLSFLEVHLGGVAPEPKPAPTEAYAWMAKIETDYEEFRLRNATQHIMELCQVANGYFDTQKPWEYKKTGNRDKMEESIAVSLSMIQLLSVAIAPLLPESADKIFSCLFTQTIEQLGWKGALNLPIKKGQPVRKPAPLFRKVEDSEIAEELAQLHRSN